MLGGRRHSTSTLNALSRMSDVRRRRTGNPATNWKEGGKGCRRRDPAGGEESFDDHDAGIIGAPIIAIAGRGFPSYGTEKRALKKPGRGGGD